MKGLYTNKFSHPPEIIMVIDTDEARRKEVTETLRDGLGKEYLVTPYANYTDARTTLGLLEAQGAKVAGVVCHDDKNEKGYDGFSITTELRERAGDPDSVNYIPVYMYSDSMAYKERAKDFKVDAYIDASKETYIEASKRAAAGQAPKPNFIDEIYKKIKERYQHRIALWAELDIEKGLGA